MASPQRKVKLRNRCKSVRDMWLASFDQLDPTPSQDFKKGLIRECNDNCSVRCNDPTKLTAGACTHIGTESNDHKNEICDFLCTGLTVDSNVNGLPFMTSDSRRDACSKACNKDSPPIGKTCSDTGNDDQLQCTIFGLLAPGDPRSSCLDNAQRLMTGLGIAFHERLNQSGNQKNIFD